MKIHLGSDHWDKVEEALERVFNSELKFIQNHVERMHREGHLQEPQDELTNLEVTRDNLIFCIENIFSEKKFSHIETLAVENARVDQDIRYVEL